MAITERTARPANRAARARQFPSARRCPSVRQVVQLLLDVAVLAAAHVVSYAPRFELAEAAEGELGAQLALVVTVQVVALWISGARGVLWRYVGLADLPLFLKGLCLALVPLLSVGFLPFPPLQALRIPASVLVLDAVLAFGGVVGLRIARRALHEGHTKRRRAAGVPPHRRRILLVGAGHAGVLSVQEIRGHGNTDLDPVGFVDDDPLKVGSVIHGVPVLGTSRDIPELVARHRPDHVVITIASAEPARLRRIIAICEKVPIKVRTIPGFHELLQGDLSLQRIRDVEPADLLGRAAVESDAEQLRALLTDRRIMVTGAGGSIGSELARQIAAFRPAHLVLVDRAEFALFQIDREMGESSPEIEVAAALGDVCDERRMRGLLQSHAPDVVIHAAAHKHLPLLEAQPTEAVKNNVFGTASLGELCGKSGVETFVLISTDKAVRPTSAMGASKRIAELVVHGLNQRYETRFVAVRFGNVLGSTGSVVSIFAEQIKRGGPVTVTDPEMTRFFMSIPEASQLVLAAAAMGEGGEVFVLDMGTPLRILELAEKMIRLSGLEPHEDIEIMFTGVRPGEKLAEELAHTGEELNPTSNPKIFVCRVPAFDAARFRAGMIRLQELADAEDEPGLRRSMHDLLPEAELGVRA